MEKWEGMVVCKCQYARRAGGEGLLLALLAFWRPNAWIRCSKAKVFP